LVLPQDASNSQAQAIDDFQAPEHSEQPQAQIQTATNRGIQDQNP